MTTDEKLDAILEQLLILNGRLACEPVTTTLEEAVLPKSATDAGIGVNRVREKRLGIGISQSKLAQLAAVPQAHLSMIETGKAYAWPRARKNLAWALKCPEGELFPANIGESKG